MRILFRGKKKVGIDIQKSISSDDDFNLTDYQSEINNPFDMLIVDFVSSTIEANRDINKLKSDFDLESVPVVYLVSNDIKDMTFTLWPDEIVICPYNRKVLAAYLNFYLQKYQSNGDSSVVKSGELTINEEKYEVKLVNEVIDLTYKEYELLRHLVKNKNRVFERDTLLKDIWGYDYYGGSRTVDVHIRRLRAKLGVPTCFKIETVRNVGYRYTN